MSNEEQQRQAPQTIRNLESAMAMESVSHLKYLYFAKIARSAGNDEIAEQFEAAANNALNYAFSHLGLLVGIPDIDTLLVNATETESWEARELYTEFATVADFESEPWQQAADRAEVELEKQAAQKYADLYKDTAKNLRVIAESKQQQAEGFKSIAEKLEKSTT